MEAWHFVAFVGIAVLADSVWVALFSARPVGKFRVVLDNKLRFDFASTPGTFSLNRATRVLSYHCGKLRGSLKLAEITGLEYHVNANYALLEELFFGLDCFDLMSQYADTVEWFSITAVADGDRRIPLFVSGRYLPREFMLGWYIDLQAAVLSKVGLLKDVEGQSRSALELLQARLGTTRLL